MVIRVSRSLFRKMLEGYPAAAQKIRDMVAERVDTYMRELGGVKQALEKGDYRDELEEFLMRKNFPFLSP